MRYISGYPIGHTVKNYEDSVVVLFQSSPSICDHMVNYTILLLKSTGMLLAERVVTPNSCNEGLCTTNFSISENISDANQNYTVTVMTRSLFGTSEIAHASIELFCSRLTTANQVLLAIGVVLQIITISLCLLCVILIVKKKGIHIIIMIVSTKLGKSADKQSPICKLPFLLYST